MINKTTEAPTLSFTSQKEFKKWLHKNHNSSDGLWVKFAKKNSNIPTLSPEEALETALCYGWIDGQKKSFDAQYFLNKYTPRRNASLWSKRNCEIAERLIASGRMQQRGLNEIKRAKEDGRWEKAYDSPRNMEMPSDFLDRIKQSQKAFSFFNTLNKANTFAIAFRLQTARKPETREKRMAKILEMMENGEKFH